MFEIFYQKKKEKVIETDGKVKIESIVVPKVIDIHESLKQ